MIDIDYLIEELNKKSTIYFEDHFNIRQTSRTPKLSIYRADGTSYAINRFEIPLEKVKVFRWFNDYWMFFEIKKLLVPNTTHFHLNLSICVFQGDTSDEDKYQLFRAEWDDYDTDNQYHSQPHWHITSSQALEKTFTSYANDFEKKDFIDLLEDEKNKVFDVKQIHFAMNGNWHNDQSNIHRILDNESVIKWWIGLVNHLRLEIDI